MTMRKGLPAKKAATDADDTRWDFLNLVTRNADGTPRQGITSPIFQGLLSGTATMNVTVAAFTAVARRDNGVVLLANDGPVNVLIGTAPTSNSRIDLIAARQNDSSSTVSTPDANDLALIYVIPGVAAASPVAPALPDGSVELGRVVVTAGNTNTNQMSLGGGNIYTAAPGDPVPFPATNLMNAWTTAKQGQLAYNYLDGAIYKWFNLYNATTNPTGRATAGWKVWDTTAPISYYTAGSTFPNYTSAAGDNVIATYTAQAGRITVDYRFKIVSGGGLSATALQVLLPFAAHAKYGVDSGQWQIGVGTYLNPGNIAYAYGCYIQANTLDRVTPNLLNATGTYLNPGAGITSTTPVAQNPGYIVTGNISYDPA